MSLRAVAKGIVQARFLLPLLICTSSISCSYKTSEQEKTREQQAAKLSEQRQSRSRIEKAKAVVTKDFFDPESARFRDLRQKIVAVAKDPGTRVRILCGEVNSKNRFGAYVGYRPFVTVIATSVPLTALRADQWWPEDTLVRSSEVHPETSNTEDIVREMLEKLTFETTCRDSSSIPPLELLANTHGLTLAERSDASMTELEKRSADPIASSQEQTSSGAQAAPRQHIVSSQLIGTWGSPDAECDGGEVTFQKGGTYSTQEGGGRWSLEDGTLSLTNWRPSTARISVLPGGGLSVEWANGQKEAWSRSPNCSPPQ